MGNEIDLNELKWSLINATEDELRELGYMVGEKLDGVNALEEMGLPFLEGLYTGCDPCCRDMGMITLWEWVHGLCQPANRRIG